MIRALLLLAVFAGPAFAQEPAPAAEPPPDDGQSVELTPTKVDAASCLPLDLTPGALLHATPTGPNTLATPIAWSDFEVQGRLIDKPEVVHALLEPTLAQFRTSLSTATLPMVAQMTARFGYQLVGQHTLDVPDGTKLVLDLAPLPLVRKVDVDVKDQPLFGKVLDDEVKRRMSIRRGSYLPWEPIRRQCALLDEQRRVQEFLFDQGYFDAVVNIYYVPRTAQYADVRAVIRLKTKYDIGTVTVNCPPGSERRKNRCYDIATDTVVELPISDSAIRTLFAHTRHCLIGSICWGGGFTRDQYQQDIKTTREQIQRRGYPAVRVLASDPRTTINRQNHTVNPAITIDPRRRVEVEFVGYDSSALQESALRSHLTFDVAGSADDVEVAESARKLTTYLQTRGYFDAHVTTWPRERVDVEPRPGSGETGIHFDRVKFQLDAGHIRRVTDVEFVGNTAISSDTLRGLVATKVANLGGSLFGTTAAATSPELILDQERIKEEYRRAGYANARVWPSASVSPAALDNAALTSALLGVDDTSNLYVRFTIEEGDPTLLTRIVVTAPNDKPLDDALCADILSELAGELGERDVARRTDKDQCATTIAGLKYRYDDVAGTRDRLREYLFKAGRARAAVDYVAIPFGVNRVEARYTVKDTDRLKVGKIVIRGASRTNEKIIRDELLINEGDVLTTDRLADGARRLRNMGLFEAVNIEMPDLECEKQERTCNSEVINAVVRVEERYVYRAEVGVEGGYSTLNGAFGTARWTQGNLLGRGILFRFSGTYGTKLREAEGTLRFPQWLPRGYLGVPRSIALTTDLTGLYRQQDTERFGRLTTKGVTVGVSRQWPRQRTETNVARSRGIGLQYDFRIRNRNVDALRPIGADMDQSQVAISTRTGSIRFNAEWEQRVDRNGQLSPLAPEDGFRLEGSVAYASPYLAGQNTFLKFSGYAAKFFPIGKNMVLRFDGRYDQGVPLGQGEVLLPEVERFFAGGDSTVRGYAEDRLKTEIIQVGVPPLDNVSQIRVIPVGGNIRTLASVDTQVRIWKILAGALFADAGLITNNWRVVGLDDVRPSVGMGLRALTPFGIGALEYAVPIRPQLGDDPRGRIHFYFAARAQF